MTLGDRGVGWFGTFHPINFIFSRLALAALSFHQMLAGEGIITTTIRECTALQENSSPILRFKSTPFPPEAPERFDGGLLTVVLQLVYSNPIAERLEALHDKLKKLQDSLVQQRKMYLIPLRDKVDEYVQDTEAKLSAIEGSLKTISQNLP